MSSVPALTKPNKLFRCPIITQWLFLWQELMACLPSCLIEHMTFVSTKWPIFISLLSFLFLQLSKSYNFIFSRIVFISITFNSTRFTIYRAYQSFLEKHVFTLVLIISLSLKGCNNQCHRMTNVTLTNLTLINEAIFL